MTPPLDSLMMGRLYRFRTITQKKGMFVGRYMGRDYADRLLFDLRPNAGTVTVPARDIKYLAEAK